MFAARSRLKEQLGELIKEGRSDLCACLSKEIAETFMAFDRSKSIDKVVFTNFSKRILEVVRLVELD